MTLFPLKFRPRLVEKMWGGRKLQTILGKPLPPGKMVGESWELFDFPPGVVDGSRDWVSSEIENGVLGGRTLHWAVGEFKSDLYGDVRLVGEHGQFPLLVKFLDAREDLSVQVHPDESYARANPGSHLKSEAWYVLHADPGSRILNGLRPGTTRDRFQEALARGDVERLIRNIPAKQDACFYLPSGTVHALGAGILVAEVQTPSDTTFRVFDFNRVDPSTGKPRALHVAQALDCIDFSGSDRADDTSVPGSAIVGCPYFEIHRLHLNSRESRAIPSTGPSILIGISGSAELSWYAGESTGIRPGDVWLLPASLKDPSIRAAGLATLLQVTFPVR